MNGKRYAVYNPHNKPESELPVIYGFNNGGSEDFARGLFIGVLLAEDGTCLGTHGCTKESFMYHDLGILHGSRADRHRQFKEHYPDGYRMDFVPLKDVLTHAGLREAHALNQQRSGEKSNV